MNFDLIKRILNILMIPPLLFFAGEIEAQCDVFIEPGSVVVTDNGSGVKFEFDITNNSSTDWYGDDLKMYWSLNSGAPIWNIDYSQNTNQPPIGPGETRTIKTPWFDIPNLPSWFPDDPTTTQPWVESMEWPYYNLSFPFQGSWSPMNLRLGSCGLADGAWVYGPDGELYYGPFDTDCPDVNNDAMCDCDLEITSFDPVSLDIEVEVVSHWNCGQPLNGLNNNGSSNNDAVGMIHFGIHVPGWDYQWGCTSGIIHPGWAFGGWSALNNPNLFLYSGDIYQGNLNDLSLNGCFGEILSSDTISECKEIVLWQINFSQTLGVADGGWAVFPNSGNQTQEYPDFSIIDNSILICTVPDVNGCTDPAAINYNPNANTDDGSCEYLYPNANPGVNLYNTTCLDGTPANIYNITIYNPGGDTLFYYCVEIPELNYDECFNGYQTGQYWIEPGGGQTITQVTIPEGIEQITINVYEAEGEAEETFSDNIELFPVVFNGSDPCEILGCNNPIACNYNSEVTEDDGSCVFCDTPNGEELCNAYHGEGSNYWEFYSNIFNCGEGCTDPSANNYNPDATEDDGSCTYDELTLDLGSDIIWTPQGTCVNPFYNQSFVVNNTGEGVIDNFSLEVVVVTWDGDLIYEGTQNYNVSIDPNGSYTVSDFPDMFTGDLNYVSATLTWVNELGQLETDTQSFNLILYCWGCTDPEANNYTESEYIFDEVQTHWLTAFPNIQPPSPEQVECTYDVTELDYLGAECTVYCDENGPYYYVTTTFQNTGNVTITDFCVEWNVIGGEEDIQCFNGTLEPGETIELVHGPLYQNGSGVVWVYLQELNGVVLDPEIGFYENITCSLNAEEVCVYGCTDDTANNYDPDADLDDGSCTYDVLGCTDPDAENYNPNANIDDGSCQIGGCTIEQACNYNPDATYNDGSCDFESCVGCTDPEAINYDPIATEDDGSCIYPIYGCTDPEAFNYDPLANTDDGSCVDVVVGCMIPEAINYNPLANIQCTPIDECCIFPEGCTDPEANNYDPNALIDDGSCTYDVLGCTDSTAINYNPNANVDDGSCIYLVYGCTDMDALNYNPSASVDDGTCIYPGPCDEFDGSAFAPNAFTPNNDGLNDGWRVLTETDCWNKWELIIYNRWGQVVYEMNDPSQVWDGSFRGGDYYVSDGVYAYTLRAVAWNLESIEITGVITVLR